MNDPEDARRRSGRATEKGDFEAGLLRGEDVIDPVDDEDDPTGDNGSWKRGL